MPEATCAGCGCACDDLVARADGERVELVSGACPRGADWFAARAPATAPLARIDGAEAALDDALDVAAAILRGARSPLIFGLGGTSCEAQREAVTLADALGAAIDTTGPLLDGASGAVFPILGASTATLGDIRDRAQIVVIWRADPMRTHPRLLERLRLTGPERGAQRTLIVIDAERTATAELADTFIELAPDDDFDALWALRALARGLPLDAGLAAALPLDALHELAGRLRACENGAILHDGALGSGAAGERNAFALNALARDLSGLTHIVTALLRAEGNAAGAQDVLAWQTGYPSSVGLQAGHPRSEPGRLSAATLLARGEADTALVVACDAFAVLPAAAAARLREIPLITIDAADTETARAARVAFMPACAGIHRAGTLHRMDGVPLPLRALTASDRPGDEELLAALHERIAAGVPA